MQSLTPLPASVTHQTRGGLSNRVGPDACDHWSLTTSQTARFKNGTAD